jgi:cytochrome P450
MYFDFTRPEVVADPYPHYARYRELDPVHRAPTGHPIFAEQWFLFRHADVLAALRDPRLGRDWHRVAPGRSAAAVLPAPLRALVEMIDSWLLFQDPPRHTELRAPLRARFRPRALAPLEPFVGDAAAALLEKALRSGASFDLLADFALPLTSGAIAEVLGIPAAERARFVEAMRGLEKVFGGSRAELPRAAAAAHEVARLFESVVAADAAERKQAIANAILIFGAGFATTVHAIANGVLALIRHPNECARLRADPALLPSAVEEILRFDPPVQRSQRFALEPVEIGGVRIPRGAHVVPVLGSANRDPAAFSDPDRFDVARDARAQVGFGGGLHVCLGAWLARLEVRVALEALLRALPRLALADEGLEWREGAARGVRRLALARA